MNLAIQTSADGVRRAEKQFLQSTSKLSTWDLPGTSGDPAYTLDLKGEARPRLYGVRPTQGYALSSEIVQMKQAEFSYRANLSALKTSIEMDDALLN